MPGSNSEFQSKARKRITHSRKKNSFGHGMMFHIAQWTKKKEGKKKVKLRSKSVAGFLQ